MHNHVCSLLSKQPYLYPPQEATSATTALFLLQSFHQRLALTHNAPGSPPACKCWGTKHKEVSVPLCHRSRTDPPPRHQLKPDPPSQDPISPPPTAASMQWFSPQHMQMCFLLLRMKVQRHMQCRGEKGWELALLSAAFQSHGIWGSQMNHMGKSKQTHFLCSSLFFSKWGGEGESRGEKISPLLFKLVMPLLLLTPSKHRHSGASALKQQEGTVPKAGFLPHHC